MSKIYILIRKNKNIFCCILFTDQLLLTRECSGRVLDSRLRGRGFEPHRCHCIVVLEQDTFILAEYGFNPGRLVPV